MPKSISQKSLYCLLIVTFLALLAACSPPVTSRTPFVPSATITRTSTATPAPVTSTLTPTHTPTSNAPGVPPRVQSPVDGAVLSGSMPTFVAASPPGSWTIHFVITSEDGYFQEIIQGVGAGLSGWMNSMYTPATLVPLPPGTYHWVAVGCRETAVGGCSPPSASRTFTIRP